MQANQIMTPKQIAGSSFGVRSAAATINSNKYPNRHNVHSSSQFTSSPSIYNNKPFTASPSTPPSTTTSTSTSTTHLINSKMNKMSLGVDGSQSLTQLLMSAVHSGELVNLQRLCTTSPKAVSVLVKYRDISGTCALLCASAEGHLDIVKFLLEIGADVNSTNSYGWNALLLSVYHRKSLVLRYLITLSNINLDSFNAFGYTPLMIAIQRGYRDHVHLLLNAGADPNFRGSSYSAHGYSPLMLACLKGDSSLVSSLLGRGAEANAQNKLNMWSPLMYAAITADFDTGASIAKLLTDYGADIHSRNCIGKTCIDIASELGNEIFQDILNVPTDQSSHYSSSKGDAPSKKKKKQHAIFDAILSKNRPLLISLLSSDADCVHQLEKATGFTPLMHAAAYGDYIAVKYLLESGADIEAKHKPSQFTPLMFAVYYRHLECVKILLEYGARQKATGMITDEGPLMKRGKSATETTAAMFSSRDIALMNGDTDVLQMMDGQVSRSNSSLKASSPVDIDGQHPGMKWKAVNIGISNALESLIGKLKEKGRKFKGRDSMDCSKPPFRYRFRRKISAHETCGEAPNRTSQFNLPFFEDSVIGTPTRSQVRNSSNGVPDSNLTIHGNSNSAKSSRFNTSLQYISVLTRSESNMGFGGSSTQESKKIAKDVDEYDKPRNMKQFFKRMNNPSVEQQEYLDISVDELMNVKSADELHELGISHHSHKYAIFNEVLNLRQEMTRFQVQKVKMQIENLN